MCKRGGDGAKVSSRATERRIAHIAQQQVVQGNDFQVSESEG